MVRHVVMFRWGSSTTSDDVGRVEEGLAALASVIPEIRSYRYGRDAGINDGTFDFAVVADFDSPEDYFVYRDHPAHRSLISERIDPHIADRAAVQFEY